MNIPLELRERPQWVAATADKVPFNPRTGEKASVINPRTWATFEEARACGAPYVGFVLNAFDPYVVIDIDDKKESPASDAERERQAKVLNSFQSYTERSVGERWTDAQGAERGGYHVVLKGEMQGGRDRGHIGVYGSARYIIFTGDVVRVAPIIEEQALLDDLLTGMPVTEAAELIHVESDFSDATLHDIAMAAANGEKYAQLCRGEWEAMGYASQSEADMALLSMLAFYSPDNEQVKRVFRCTALGKRPKATDSDYYLNRTLATIRARHEAERSNEEALAASRDLAKATVVSPAPSTDLLPDFPSELLLLPHGLGQLQSWILGTMTYPSPATAGITALAVMAHFAMTRFRIDSRRGLGLNEQFLILAPSTFGKEELRAPFAELQTALRLRGLRVVTPFLQYSAPASLQGMHIQLQNHHAQTYLADEFAEWLAYADKGSFRGEALGYYMQAYTKAFSTLAAPGAVTNSYLPVENPKVLIFATSTTERILETINASQADSGALNRFVFFVAEQDEVAKRYDFGPDAYKVPDKICDLVAWIVAGDPITVRFTADAWELYKAHDRRVLDPLKRKDNRLAGRLNEQAFKMAALIALSDRRQEIEVGDLRIAYAIREGLYYRVHSLIGHDGALSGMHATGSALEQIRQLLVRESFLYRSQLAKRSRRFNKLSLGERDAVIRALVRDGYAKEEGAKLTSLICEESN